MSLIILIMKNQLVCIKMIVIKIERERERERQRVVALKKFFEVWILMIIA